MRRMDLTGQVFGKLTVVGFVEIRGKSQNAIWLCVCKCTNTRLVAAGNLRCGSAIACKDCSPKGPVKQNPLDRFMKYVNKNGPIPDHRPELGPCWLWTGAKDDDGYGYFEWRDEGIKTSHRASCKLFKSDFNPELQALHLCDNPTCVNYSHLIQGTNEENVADMVLKQRHLIGERNPAAKLTEETVREILHRYVDRPGGRPLGTSGPNPNSLRALAKEFGLSKRNIQNIVQRKSWKHIKL